MAKFEELNPNGSVKKNFRWVKWAVAGGLALILCASSFTVVPAGSTGVVITLGKVSESSFQEGFHLKIPFIQHVEVMSNKIQVYESPASAVSKDLQTVSSTIAVNYRISSDASGSIYKNVGTDYKTVLITPVVQECMKSVTAKYTAEQLITERAQVGEEVKTALDSKLNSYGIYIEKFNIVNFDFTAEFNAAIEAKQVAEQNLLKTKTEQEQAIVVADAEAQKKVIAANAEAEAILAEAQAQAEANELINSSITDKVLASGQLNKWHGVLPKVTGSDGGFLIDVDLNDIESTTSSAQPTTQAAASDTEE